MSAPTDLPGARTYDPEGAQLAALQAQTDAALSAPVDLPGVEAPGYDDAGQLIVDRRDVRDWLDAATAMIHDGGSTVRRIDYVVGEGCDCGFVREDTRGCAACRGGRR